ncbi:MAG: c-type cytochrome [Nitrospirae bacterium]|uniref:c-type cytochrome n=1 Tax=Candidatus Magnetobacterium casense TaxID=1455061 RepID=UPI000590B594|nr:c-type cytochrome [Candidatus Magnetobacterium casensis]MBF0338119.1 c-type cytochrome [Nitrospirota bacterium]
MKTIAAIILVIVSLMFPVSGYSEDALKTEAKKPVDASAGKSIYDAWCAQCHGYKGDADAYTKDVTLPLPRDFAFGVYKFRSSAPGEPPTDADLTRIIRKGNPGTSMPPWERFTDDEVKAIVAHVKTFAPDVFSSEAKSIKLDNPPKSTPESIAKGKELFNKAKCVECHGKEGRGNGEKGWQADFKTDWGYRVAPANYTHAWELRNGSDLVDIYRTISAGLAGTPMTSYLDSLKDDERWSLAHFIKSLQVTRKLGLALKVKLVKSLPAGADDPVWKEVEYMDLPMGGQLMFEPRHFTPTITNTRVRGVYTSTEIAIMLEWTDKQPSKGADNVPSDTAHIQFPTKMEEGAERPYFYLGSRKATVNLWQWKASEDNKVASLTGKGYDMAPEPKEKQNVTAVGTYTDGLYRVIFKRALNTGVADDSAFAVGKFIPFAVQLFDGNNGEDANKAAISAWYFLMTEPPTPLKVYVMPPIVTVLVFAVGLIMHNNMKTQRKNKKKK